MISDVYTNALLEERAWYSIALRSGTDFSSLQPVVLYPRCYRLSVCTDIVPNRSVDSGMSYCLDSEVSIKNGRVQYIKPK